MERAHDDKLFIPLVAYSCPLEDKAASKARHPEEGAKPRLLPQALPGQG